MEDVKLWSGFVTFVVTARRNSPSSEKMINFCYLHCCPEGFSVGLTHLSFPLCCSSNGNEIECAASWVCLSRTFFFFFLSREDIRKKNYLLIMKTALSIWRCSTHTVQSSGSSKQHTPSHPHLQPQPHSFTAPG